MNNDYQIPNITTVLALTVLLCFAQPCAAQSQPVPVIRHPPIRGVDPFQTWMNGDWTDSDKPYAEARSQIDAEIASGTPPSKILNDLQAKCWQPTTGKWQSPTVEVGFAIGYAGAATKVAADCGTLDSDAGWAALTGFVGYIDLHAETFPHTYNLVRLAFFADGDDQHGVFVNVGEKLLRRDPKDQLVADILIYALLASDKIPELARASDLAAERLSAKPDGTSYELVGLVKTAYFKHTHNPRFAREAIADYQRAIAVSPTHPGDRAIYSKCIAKLQQELSGPAGDP